MRTVIKFLPVVFALGMLASCSNSMDDNVGSSNGTKTFAYANLSGAKEDVGRSLFFDSKLSQPAGESCATCHAPKTAYSDITHRIESEGAVKGLFGNRNSPTATYSCYTPALHFDAAKNAYVGGQFWDGRAASLKDQAMGPLLNPLEMGNPCKDSVVAKLKRSKYYPQYINVYGKDNTIDKDFSNIAEAIASYENTNPFVKFNSKYDGYLAHTETLTADEAAGLQLFQSKGKCAECHSLTPDPQVGKPLFTDFAYANVGMPKNPNNPFYNDPAKYNPAGKNYVDLGLGVTVKDPNQNGKFRVQTLRNIALTAPYGHNGYFATLKDVVHFFNTRDVNSSYPAPEYAATVDHTQMGNLGLTDKQENQIVAFLNTLTDRQQ